MQAIYFATGRETHIRIALDGDAFSRVIGIPVIGTLGLMQVTHGLPLVECHEDRHLRIRRHRRGGDHALADTAGCLCPTSR
jgi:hypothetical protein